MKKLIFLLLMAVALVGVVFANDTAHPPGVLTVNMADTIEAILYGDSADGRAVTPDTVLVALPATVALSSFQAVMALNNDDETAIQPQSGAIPVTNTGQFRTEPAMEETIAEADYYLRY